MKTQRDQNWFKKHKVLSIVIALAVVVVVASLASSPETQTGSTSKQASDDSKTAQQNKIGQAARDGKFEFTVNKLSCGEATIGNEYLHARAQGQFCRVNVTVKNIGDQPQTLSHTDQYAYNDQGQKYSANSDAAIYSAGDAATTWFTDINPGNTVSGDIFFDMPKDVTPASIELHDSPLSGGVRISLK